MSTKTIKSIGGIPIEVELKVNEITNIEPGQSIPLSKGLYEVGLSGQKASYTIIYCDDANSKASTGYVLPYPEGADMKYCYLSVQFDWSNSSLNRNVLLNDSGNTTNVNVRKIL